MVEQNFLSQHKEFRGKEQEKRERVFPTKLRPELLIVQGKLTYLLRGDD